jgi:hypothetical protein
VEADFLGKAESCTAERLGMEGEEVACLKVELQQGGKVELWGASSGRGAHCLQTSWVAVNSQGGDTGGRGQGIRWEGREVAWLLGWELRRFCWLCWNKCCLVQEKPCRSAVSEL